jgi:thiamine-phosphate pyrophosphorylase
MRGYYFITNSELSLAGNANDVQQVVAAGVEVVQYRRKEGSTKALFAEASALRQLSRNALFLINDRVDIALAVDADGVHLGQEDMPIGPARKLLGARKVIGLTVHSVEEAMEASALGADYLGVSPIFSTHTKTDAGPPAGIELIRQIKSAVNLPIVAIGGINLANATQVIAAGADCVCAISAVVTRSDFRAAIKEFQRLFAPRPQ